MKSKASIQAILDTKRARLAMYLEREALMLSEDGIRTYALGSRSVSRYDTDLKAIQAAIMQLGDEIAELEAALLGERPRKAVGVVPRDW